MRACKSVDQFGDGCNLAQRMGARGAGGRREGQRGRRRGENHEQIPDWAQKRQRGYLRVRVVSQEHRGLSGLGC